MSLFVLPRWSLFLSIGCWQCRTCRYPCLYFTAPFCHHAKLHPQAQTAIYFGYQADNLNTPPIHGNTATANSVMIQFCMVFSDDRFAVISRDLWYPRILKAFASSSLVVFLFRGSHGASYWSFQPESRISFVPLSLLRYIWAYRRTHLIPT